MARGPHRPAAPGVCWGALLSLRLICLGACCALRLKLHGGASGAPLLAADFVVWVAVVLQIPCPSLLAIGHSKGGLPKAACSAAEVVHLQCSSMPCMARLQPAPHASPCTCAASWLPSAAPRRAPRCAQKIVLPPCAEPRAVACCPKLSMGGKATYCALLSILLQQCIFKSNALPRCAERR